MTSNLHSIDLTKGGIIVEKCPSSTPVPVPVPGLRSPVRSVEADLPSQPPPLTSPFPLPLLAIPLPPPHSLSLLLHLLLGTVPALPLEILIRLPFRPRRIPPVPRTPLVQILLQPLQYQLAQLAIPRQHPLILRIVLNTHVLYTAPLLHFPQRHVHEMRGPRREVIQDMRRVHNRARALVRLLLEEREEVAAAEQVEIDGDFVEEQDRPGPEKPHGELHAAALAVGDRVHAPRQVDVKDVDELVAAFRVVLSADGVEQCDHVDVGADDGVQDPFQAEVGYAFEAVLERVDAGDRDGVRGGHAFTGEEAEEGGFAGAVG